MWKNERVIRVAREDLLRLNEQRKKLDDGVVFEELRNTPRGRKERSEIWTEKERIDKRLAARDEMYKKTIEKERQLEKKIVKEKKRMIRRRRLPMLHLSMLRQPGIIPQEFIDDPECHVSQIQGPHKWRTLHLAIQQQSREAIQTIMADPGCVIDAQDSSGATALHFAMSNPKLYDIAEKLVRSGADLTLTNRSGLTPVQTALSLGLYTFVAQFLEKFTIWELACMHARRFFTDYFAGDPMTHHYQKVSFEQHLMYAYTVTMYPRLLKFGIPRYSKVRAFIGMPTTMSNIERFYHDFLGNCKFDRRFNSRFKKKKKKKKNPVKKKKKDGDEPNSDDEEDEIEENLFALKEEMNAEKKALEDVEDFGELNVLPGLFREFPIKSLRQMRTKAFQWRFDRGRKFTKKIAERPFEGKMTPEEVLEKFKHGRELFMTWKSKNKATLLQDETRRLCEVADAMRLKRLREEREKRREKERELQEQERLERQKRGLDKLDPNACVILSEDELVYDVDEGESMQYSIVLGSMPTGPVLIKFTVEQAKSKSAPQFTVTPTLTTFTPKNWSEEQVITISPSDDDCIVRLKRQVAQGERGSNDHNVVHSIQSTTDWSYKYFELRWDPSNTLKVNVR